MGQAWGLWRHCLGTDPTNGRAIAGALFVNSGSSALGQAYLGKPFEAQAASGLRTMQPGGGHSSRGMGQLRRDLGKRNDFREYGSIGAGARARRVGGKVLAGPCFYR